MYVLVMGINHKSAPVSIREQMAFRPEEIAFALDQLKNTKSMMECVIVSTCNRMEIYAVVDHLSAARERMTGFLSQWFRIPLLQFQSHLFIYENDQAIAHLFRVASGLDSLVIGETQILGQVRDAYQMAFEQKTTGTWFNQLFKQAITFAKRVHAETQIGEQPVSVSYAAIELGKTIFKSYVGKDVLILGAGKMSELALKHLQTNGVNSIYVANRTFERAQELARRFHAIAIPWDERTQLLAIIDVVISSTGSSERVLTKANVEEAMKQRQHRPLYLIDIAVPRDLDPDIAMIPNVFLHDLDQFEQVIDQNLSGRTKIAQLVQNWIEEEVNSFQQWIVTLGVVPLIQALQKKVNNIQADVFISLTQKLAHLSERDRNIIRKLMKSITNQVLREPILNLKESAVTKDHALAQEWFATFFGIQNELEKLQGQDDYVKKGEWFYSIIASLDNMQSENDDREMTMYR